MPVIVYSVLEPPGESPGAAPRDLNARTDRLVFVPDGFSFKAFLFGPFWLAAQRMWLPLLGYLALFAALQLLSWAIAGGQAATVLLALVMAAAVGWEAHSLRLWTLDRAGYRTLATVCGRTLDECEHRFFSAWLENGMQAVTLPAAVPAGAVEQDPRTRIRNLALGLSGTPRAGLKSEPASLALDGLSPVIGQKPIT